MTFIRIYNPNHDTNLKKLHSCVDKIKNKELKSKNYYYSLDNLKTYQTFNYSKI